MNAIVCVFFLLFFLVHCCDSMWVGLTEQLHPDVQVHIAVVLPGEPD